MSIKLITPAAELPVSLEDFKLHLRRGIEKAEDDYDLTIKLKAGIKSIEAAIGYPIVHSTWDWYTDYWPCELPHDQVSAITHIKYTPTGAAQETVSADAYSLVGAYDESVPAQYAGQARVVLAYGQSWPSTTLETGEPIVTRIVSGWKDADSVPEDLKSAIKLEAAHLYAHRESVTLGNTAVEAKAMARGVDHFISQYKRWKF